MADLRAQLKARTDKLNGMMEAAAQSAAQIDDLKSQLDGARVDVGELEELRELKKDIERKEKQQAAIIENQVGCGCGGVRRWRAGASPERQPQWGCCVTRRPVLAVRTRSVHHLLAQVPGVMAGGSGPRNACVAGCWCTPSNSMHPTQPT